MTKRSNAEWIPVAERLPEVPKGPYYAASNCVLITVIEDPELETAIKPYVTVAHLMKFRDEEPTWLACGCNVVGYCDELREWKLNQISHWMLKPAPPEEK